MSIELEHPKARVQIDELSTGKKHITVQSLDESIFIPIKDCDTSYSVELIQHILNAKSPSGLCDEIERDEEPSYVQIPLEKSILGYVDESIFVNKRLLDFGCGCGSSTIILARMFPQTEIVGVELCREFLEVAELRSKHHQCDRVKFILSRSGTNFPLEIGNFDFVVLNAVYEHLLPNERQLLIPQIWSLIKPGGILFINETPYRYSPLEGHTTGLPLINYLPDNMALAVARRFCKRVEEKESWENLLRRGVRGATAGEILNVIRLNSDAKPIILEPNRLGFTDRIDLWYDISSGQRLRRIKQLVKVFLKNIKLVFGVTLVTSLSLAIRKDHNP